MVYETTALPLSYFAIQLGVKPIKALYYVGEIFNDNGSKYDP